MSFQLPSLRLLGRGASSRAPLAVFVGAALLAAACGQPATVPGAAPAPPTSAAAPANQAPVTAAPTQAPAPTRGAATGGAPAPGAPAKPGGAQATQAVAAPSPIAAPAGGVTFTIVPAESEARFVARELLAANTIQNDAVGRTRDLSGQIALAPNGQVQPESKIVVNIQSLTSDRDQRDSFIKQTVLQTRQFPSAEFVPTEIQGLATPIPTSGEATFKLLGNLTVHGVTQPATWDVKATFSPSTVTGTATTVVRLDQFGMQKPRVPVVASIEDNIRLELDVKATRGA